VKSMPINASLPAVTWIEREGRRNAAGVAASEIVCIYAPGRGRKLRWLVRGKSLALNGVRNTKPQDQLVCRAAQIPDAPVDGECDRK